MLSIEQVCVALQRMPRVDTIEVPLGLRPMMVRLAHLNELAVAIVPVIGFRALPPELVGVLLELWA